MAPLDPEFVPFFTGKRTAPPEEPPPPPENITPPTISGSPVVGATLTLTPGVWVTT